MGSLFGITTEYIGLMSQIEELGGEVTPELAEQLAINESNMATKCRAYFHIINEKESEIGLAKAEQERLDGQIKSREVVINRLKKTLIDAVEVFGVIEGKAVNKSINLGDLKLSLRKSVVVEIEEGQVIDDERFCLKEAKFALNYNQANQLTNILINNPEFKVVPDTNIKVQKVPLKEWLIDNEENNKVLISKYNEDLKTEMMDLENAHPIANPLSNEQLKDLKVAFAAKLKQNTSIQFK